jgi:myosin heavy subunit
MTSRKPLLPRNRDVGREGGKTSRRERYRFAILNKVALVEQVNMILQQVDVAIPHLSLTEDDLSSPSASKINQVYYACFSEVFGVAPDLSTQPSFMVDHAELMDDFAGKVQFFRLMKRLMEYCAVPDFRLTDIVNPDAKRTCRNLSAIVNFIKFHVHMAKEGQEQEEAILVQMNEYATTTQHNQDLKQNLMALQRQKQEEHEHEEELKQLITQQEVQFQQNMQQEVALQQHLQGLKEQKLKEESRKVLVQSELDKISQRIDDLRKQIVTSPDKLRARLHKLQQEIEETKASTRDSDTLMRMWESLASRAQHIPNVLKGLNEDMELLIVRTNKESDLQGHLEGIEEHISRQRQVLREASAKHQNLVRHLKFVEDESQQMAYDDQKLSVTQFRAELERWVR